MKRWVEFEKIFSKKEFTLWRLLRIHPANPLEEAEAGEVCGCD